MLLNPFLVILLNLQQKSSFFLGICLSSRDKRDEKIQSNTIDEGLHRLSEDEKNTIKIIILGTGESGKSTIMKQLMMIFGKGFSEIDKANFLKAIQSNLIIHMKMLINGCNTMKIEIKEENLKLSEEFLQLSENHTDLLLPNTILNIKRLWKDPALKQAFDRRHLLQIPDSASYFLDDINRITSMDYSPTSIDILNCRIPTLGVNCITFPIGNWNWKVVDVGGQRSERRKWLHQFEDVSLLIFVIAISEFNQRLFEDALINRMQESLALFIKTIKVPIFQMTTCAIFFNKIDLFEQKILNGQDLRECFPDYENGQDFFAAKEFIKNKFFSQCQNNIRDVFSWFTIATNTEDIHDIIHDINNTIIADKLKEFL